MSRACTRVRDRDQEHAREDLGRDHEPGLDAPRTSSTRPCARTSGAARKIEWAESRRHDGVSTGEILEIDPPWRLVTTWRSLWAPEMSLETPSRVTWEIEERAKRCLLRVTHDRLDCAPKTRAAVSRAGRARSSGCAGWSRLLLDLSKSSRARTTIRKGERAMQALRIPPDPIDPRPLDAAGARASVRVHPPGPAQGEGQRPDFLKLEPRREDPGARRRRARAERVRGDLPLPGREAPATAASLPTRRSRPERSCNRWLSFTVTELEQPLWRIDPPHASCIRPRSARRRTSRLAREDFAPMARRHGRAPLRPPVRRRRALQRRRHRCSPTRSTGPTRRSCSPSCRARAPISSACTRGRRRLRGSRRPSRACRRSSLRA